MVNTRWTPAKYAAANTNGFNSPFGAGTTIIISCTPATCAGTAFINTEDG